MQPTPPTPPKPPKFPPVQADMETVCNHSGGQSTSSSTFSRDEHGRTRVEQGNFATITDPVKGESYVLDMPKKIATPAAPPPPAEPGMPAMPPVPGVAAPQAPKPPMVETKDLGEKVINGVKAHGKQYTMPAMAGTPGKPPVPQMPGAPKLPAAPKLPGAPSMPGGLKIPGAPKPPDAPKIPGAPSAPAAPAAPGAPGAPSAPQPPTSEVWTSKELKLPVHSTMTNPALGTSCVTQMKNIKPGAKLDPKMFQVPPDFKIAPPPVKPPPLKPPALKPPALKLPSLKPPALKPPKLSMPK